jgi:hypothetical protein
MLIFTPHLNVGVGMFGFDLFEGLMQFFSILLAVRGLTPDVGGGAPAVAIPVV